MNEKISNKELILKSRGKYDYTEGADLPARPRLSDEAYGEAIRWNLNLCSDCVIVNPANKSIILPVRQAATASGPWFIGGVIAAQTEPKQNMQNVFNRETGLTMSDTDFVRVPLLDADLLPPRTLWPNGRNDAHIFYTTTLTTEQLQKIQLDEEEYAKDKKLTEYTRDDLVQGVADGTVRNIILDVYDAIDWNST